jgi:23S rRNA (adenine2503-C2)-methyltransferase
LDILHSRIDSSVNYVDWQDDRGAFESRFVQRSPEYFITYLSSHTGCNKACRMCHLTQTGQTMMREATMADYITQARAVISHFNSLGTYVPHVNYNFMARGEPLANSTVLNHWETLANELIHLAVANYGIENANLNLSTIMPSEVRFVDLATTFDQPNTNFYYSLYSMNPAFRKRWLPKAMDPNEALDKLTGWQQKTGREVALHWTFIEGENDDLATLDDIISAVHSRGLMVKFNAVRYNPYSEKQGREPVMFVLERNFAYLQDAFGSTGSRIVPRVGSDVAASCGMFPEAA